MTRPGRGLLLSIHSATHLFSALQKNSSPPKKAAQHWVDLAPLDHWDTVKNCCAYTRQNKALNNVLKARITVNIGRNPCKPEEGQGALLYALLAFVSSPESSWHRILQSLYDEALL